MCRRNAIGLILCCPLMFAGCATAHHEFAAGVREYTTVFASDMRLGVACFRIPAFAALPEGTLIAAADERVPSCNDLNDNRDINIVLRRSHDGGKSWTSPSTVVDFPDGRSASDPSLIADRITGAVFLFYNYMDHDSAPGIYRIHVMKSTDQGENWSPARDITDEITKPEWKTDFMFLTSGNGTQTREGVLLHVLVNTGRGAYVILSRDHGEHWVLNDVPLTPGDESRIVELPDGSWMVNSRVGQEHDMRFTHVSTDQGKTWTTRPEPALVDPACNAGLTLYSPGDSRAPMLLFTNANAANTRTNLAIRCSSDNGASWSTAKTLYPGSTAYSVVAPLADGGIGVVFEQDDYTKITFVRLNPEWLPHDRR